MRIALVSRELAPHVAAAARELSRIAEVTVLAGGEARPLALPDDVRVLFVEEPGPEGFGAAFSHTHAYSTRVHEVLRAAYGDDGPDLIEFCDHLGEGFVTIQAAHTGAAWLKSTLVCVRLHTSSELRDVLGGHVDDDFHTIALHDAERYCLRHADRILWPGGDVLDTYRRYYDAGALAPAVKLPPAVPDAGDGDAGRAGGPIGGEPLRLLYMGRLERRKGIHNLLRGLLELPRDDWRLTVVGADTPTGPLATSLRDQLELMTAEDPRVELSAPVPRAEVPGLIGRHDLVVVPSLWDCWPTSACEALRHNRPVLAAPVGGLCELVQPDRSGWHSAGADARALSEAVAARLDDPESITDLIATGGPRAVFEELTDPERFLESYRELARAERPRAVASPDGAAPPLVSVVVPYFRLEELVEETLDSVAAQTYANIETIVVNDGSLREEDAVLADVERRPGVRVVTQVNSGLGAARNLGIAQAQGKYVLPLDADDLIEPEFVARCVEALEADEDLAYVGTWVQYMKPDATRIVDPLGGYMPYGNWSALMERNNVAGVCSCLIRRGLFADGFGYSRELTSYEDWLLYWQLARAGHHGAIIPERLFRYRVRDDSMVREVGTPNLARLLGELRAHLLESDVGWTRPEMAIDVPTAAPGPVGDEDAAGLRRRRRARGGRRPEDAVSTLADAMRAQRDALAAELCAGLSVTVVGAEPGPALTAAAAEVTRVDLSELGRLARDSSGDPGDGPEVVACPDGIGPRTSEALLDGLAGLTAKGARLIVGLTSASAARALTERIPDAITVPQHAVEAAWIGDGAAASVEAPDRDPRDALCTIVVAGFEAEAVAAAAQGVEAAGAPVHVTHLRALEAANAELRRANTRLAAERLGTQGSAAASVLAGLRARLAAAEEKIRALEHQLAEWQDAARKNDTYFQDARRLLQTPRHRVAESVHHRVRALPGVRQAAAARARLAPSAEEAPPPPPALPEAAAPPQTTPPENTPSENTPSEPDAPAASDPEPSRTVHGTYIGDGRVLITTTWGGRLFADARDLSLTPELLAAGVYDVPFTRFVQAELRPCDVAIDVGANIGLFTLLMAQIVGPAGRVVAYEPEPGNLSLLRDNVAANYVGGWVEVVDRAAAAGAGRTTFYATERFKGNGSLMAHDPAYLAEFGVDAHAGIEVETEPLDARLAGIERIDLLKVDVEGGELQVLRGARGLLEAGTVQRLCIEVLRPRMGADWEPFVALLGELDARGWRLSRLDELGRRASLSLDELVEVGRFSQVLLEPTGG